MKLYKILQVLTDDEIIVNGTRLYLHEGFYSHKLKNGKYKRLSKEETDTQVLKVQALFDEVFITIKWE